LLTVFAFVFSISAAEWTALSPRPEIRPEFSQKDDGLTITADNRPGLDGHWRKTFRVEGGQYYKFSVRRKGAGLESERRNALVRILWRDENGKGIKRDEPGAHGYGAGKPPDAEPEYPSDHK